MAQAARDVDLRVKVLPKWVRQRYVTAVVDLYSRRVVGGSMSSSMAAQLVTDALMMPSGAAASPTAC